MKKIKFGVIMLMIGWFILMCTFGCCSPKMVTVPEYVHDTIYIEVQKVDTIVDTYAVDSLENCLKQSQDSVKFYRDSISYENYSNARRIAKINYYLDCVRKNSNNKQFFYGWIKRTMSDE